jgi:VanZ family protein
VPQAFRLRLLFWTGLAVAYWLLIFGLTHSQVGLPGPVSFFDKLEHAGAFCGLAVLLCAAYESWRPQRRAGYFAVFLAVAAYGAFDEWTQGFVGRHSDVRDWLADLGGAACGVGLMFLVAAFWRPRSAAASAGVKTR